MLITLAGALIAVLLVLFFYAVWRLLRGVVSLFRMPRSRGRVVPQPRGRVMLEKLRGLRVSRARATARAEGARASSLVAEVDKLRVELRIARAERDAALARVAQAARPASAWPWQRVKVAADDRFQQAKREFARRFHPDRVPRQSPERAVRAAVFQDFWQALRRIEAGRS